LEFGVELIPPGLRTALPETEDRPSREGRLEEENEMSGLKRIAAVATLLIASAAAAQNVVTDWNSTAITAARASTASGSATPGGANIYVAYMQLAVYNAVNAIDRRFEPYKYSLTAPEGASADAAAVEAAYRTLVHLFPDQSVLLDAQYNLSLSAIPDGPAKTNGQMLGQASSSTLIALRVNDGLGASVPYTYPSTPVPGVWILTPGATAPQTPWVGQMRPFTFDNPAQFLPDAPPDLGSKTWVDDYKEVMALGAVNSTLRTPQQTEIALFWTDHTTAQYGRLLRARAVDRKLSLVDTARLFAMAYVAEADTLIATYNAKYHFSFWRPVTAIQNGDIDGNSDTIADPNWLPLVTTPAHPEYPSAHASLTGALANTLKAYFGNPKLQVSVDSTVTNIIHNFKNIQDWQNEVALARIYVGFHYRSSVMEGLTLGKKVAENVTKNYFRPVK
jgi:PAP2 superfamily